MTAHPELAFTTSVFAGTAGILVITFGLQILCTAAWGGTVLARVFAVACVAAGYMTVAVSLMVLLR